jgi:hypothetical protein
MNKYPSGFCILPSALFMLSACQSLSPLTNKVPVGEAPFVVMVGDAPDGQAELFALPAGGGEAIRFSFDRMKKYAPAIDPTGAVVAFLRRPREASDSSPATLAVLNLLNIAVREASLPAAIGVPRRVGWSRDGAMLFVLGDSGIARSPAPPGTMNFVPVDSAGPEWPRADSATSILLGTPPLARIETCAKDCISSVAKPWCVITPEGKRQELGRVVTPFRWGSDSLAFFENDRLLIYPMGGGHPRRMEWTHPPIRPRDGNYWEARGS